MWLKHADKYERIQVRGLPSGRQFLVNTGIVKLWPSSLKFYATNTKSLKIADSESRDMPPTRKITNPAVLADFYPLYEATHLQPAYNFCYAKLDPSEAVHAQPPEGQDYFEIGDVRVYRNKIVRYDDEQQVTYFPMSYNLECMNLYKELNNLDIDQLLDDLLEYREQLTFTDRGIYSQELQVSLYAEGSRAYVAFYKQKAVPLTTKHRQHELFNDCPSIKRWAVSSEQSPLLAKQGLA